MNADKEIKLETLKATHQDELMCRKQTWEGELEHYKAINNQQLEMFKGLIAFALLALRGLILINGASAIALLAFLGHVWAAGKASAAQGLITPIWLFSLGAGMGLLAAAFAYLSQTFFAEVDFPRTNEEGFKEKNYWHHLQKSNGEKFRVAAVVVTSISFILFLVGISYSVMGFDSGINMLNEATNVGPSLKN